MHFHSFSWFDSVGRASEVVSHSEVTIPLQNVFHTAHKKTTGKWHRHDICKPHHFQTVSWLCPNRRRPWHFL